MGVIEDSGALALATRMQRLAEQMRKDGALIYKAHGIDFEPKLFAIVYTLHFKKQLSVVELANEIGFTHPSTISLLKELEKLKLVRSLKDKADERKRLVQLTEKGKTLVEQMKPVWEVITAAATDLINTQNNLLKAVAEVERQMELQSFYQRAISIMASNQNSVSQ